MDLEDGTTLPDIVMLDIKLGSTNGIDIGRQMLNIYPDVKIIFVSGYDDYFLDVYDVDHVYFLSKPVEEDRLARALEKAVAGMNEEKHLFTYTVGRSQYYIDCRKILYFENLRHKLIMHTEYSEDSFYGLISELEKGLPDYFLRCHNSFIVNIHKVDEYHPSLFIIRGREIPISRRYKEIAREAFFAANACKLLQERE